MKKNQAVLLENCVYDNLHMVRGGIYYIMFPQCYGAFNRIKKERGDLSEKWFSVGSNIISKCVKEIERIIFCRIIMTKDSYIKRCDELTNILNIISKSTNGETNEDIVEMQFDESQIRILNNICDTYSRFICGQTFSIIDWLMDIWSVSHECEIEEYLNIKSSIETYVSILHNLCWNDSDNAYNGIGYDDDADGLYDMHQVFRYELWKLQDEDKRSQYTVDAFSAMKVSERYDLIDVKLI